METGLPAHVASAHTWSAMLTWWRDRPEPAVVADGTIGLAPSCSSGRPVPAST